MAAEVKIKGNTRDAQQKVQKLRREVERLDREARKPKKVNIQGKSVLGKIGGAMGGVGAGAIAKGNLIADAIKGVLKQYIPAVARLGAGLLGEALGLKELEKAVTRVTPKVRNLVDVIETFGNPAEEALSRADKVDALDDERRSHNSQSLAEEYAYSKAFSNVAGVNGTQIVDRLQSVLDMATSGNVSEMERAWGQLQGFGVTWEDIQSGSTWQVLTKMLAAYNAAGADGSNELEPALQQIVGKRQMAAIRKIGDGTELQAQATQLQAEFNSRIPNQQAILEEAAKSEVTRAIAEIQNMAVPDEGLHHINDEANNQLSLANLRTGMLGDTKTAGEALWGLVGEIGDDLKPAWEELKDYSLKDYFMNMLGFGGGDEATNIAHANINVGAADMDVQSATPLLVEPPTQIQTGDNLTLHSLEATTPISTDAVNPTLAPIREVTAMGTSTLSRPEIVAPNITGVGGGITTTSTTELKNTLDELTRTIRDNTTSTRKAADVFSTMNVGGTGYTIGVFQ